MYHATCVGRRVCPEYRDDTFDPCIEDFDRRRNDRWLSGRYHMNNGFDSVEARDIDTDLAGTETGDHQFLGSVQAEKFTLALLISLFAKLFQTGAFATLAQE